MASTTKVANLNSDLLDDQTGSYYLDSADFTGTDWTDLTDAGATTLHKHDHGGMDGLGDDDHTIYLLADGTRALSANWDVGAFTVTALRFVSDQTTGTAPFTVASTTVVSNLNADLLDGSEGSAYLLIANIDDIPVDAETNAPISSNWAYDHENAADPHTGYRLESADHNHQSTGAQAGQLDHGLALTGLSDDDHTIYSLADGTRSFTGAVTITEGSSGASRS